MEQLFAAAPSAAAVPSSATPAASRAATPDVLAAAAAVWTETNVAEALAAVLRSTPEAAPTAAAPAAAPTAAPATAPAAAACPSRRSSRTPQPTAYGQMMDNERARAAAGAEAKRRKLINVMALDVLAAPSATPPAAPSAAGPSSDAAPAAAVGPRWECATCNMAVEVPPSPFDVQVAELLGGGQTLASVLPTYAQLELEALRSATAARALVAARRSLCKVKPDMVSKRFAKAMSQNKSRHVPPGIVKLAMAAAIAAAEERELRVKLRTWQPPGRLLRVSMPVDLWKPGLQPQESDFMLGGAEPAVVLVADFRDVGVNEYLCWKVGCDGRCKVLKTFGRTAYTNTHSPLTQPQKIGHYGRLWSISPKIKCALTT